jgi:hypothetical protein
MTSADSCQPFACSLSPAGLDERKALIGELLAQGLADLTVIPDGVQARFVTGPELKSDRDVLVELEARCCASLSLSVSDAEDTTVLEVTGAPEAQALIAELFINRSTTADPAARLM